VNVSKHKTWANWKYTMSRENSRRNEMKRDLRWFAEYAENADWLCPLTPSDWKDLARLLLEIIEKEERNG